MKLVHIRQLGLANGTENRALCGRVTYREGERIVDANQSEVTCLVCSHLLSSSRISFWPTTVGAASFHHDYVPRYAISPTSCKETGRFYITRDGVKIGFVLDVKNEKTLGKSRKNYRLFAFEDPSDPTVIVDPSVGFDITTHTHQLGNRLHAADAMVSTELWTDHQFRPKEIAETLWEELGPNDTPAPVVLSEPDPTEEAIAWLKARKCEASEPYSTYYDLAIKALLPSE